jgi:hypothetical protein
MITPRGCSEFHLLVVWSRAALWGSLGLAARSCLLMDAVLSCGNLDNLQRRPRHEVQADTGAASGLWVSNDGTECRGCTNHACDTHDR